MPWHYLQHIAANKAYFHFLAGLQPVRMVVIQAKASQFALYDDHADWLYGHPHGRNTMRTGWKPAGK